MTYRLVAKISNGFLNSKNSISFVAALIAMIKRSFLNKFNPAYGPLTEPLPQIITGTTSPGGQSTGGGHAVMKRAASWPARCNHGLYLIVVEEIG